ncbi:MAG: ABC transporter permease [Spirosomaceae bacterium]|jgi:putative ABC transport system permease protein|nr:ABC transporter permease [Spirosomataceae bacterium]
MLKHLFKLIWKKKKSSALMMLEIFVSFLILFAVSTLAVYNITNYSNPSGIKSENVWAVYFNFNTESDSLRLIYKDLVKQKLKNYKEVESFSFVSNNIPFSFSTSNWSFTNKGKKVICDVVNVEPEFQQILGIEVTEGRWFTKADFVSKNTPVVISRKAEEELFGNEKAIGKLIGEEKKYLVIGIVDSYKHTSDFQELSPTVFQPSEKWDSNMILRVKPQTDADFENKMTKELVSLGKDWSVEVQQLESMRESKNKFVLIPILVLFIISGFLIFNVTLGLFGVLFQTISQRKQEIGIRRAIGANQNHILRHFIGETAVIATFGVVLGLFFAIQFPLLNVFDLSGKTYILGILLAVIFIYVLVVICAFLPSKQASQIYPAMALHEG